MEGSRENNIYILGVKKLNFGEKKEKEMVEFYL